MRNLARAVRLSLLVTGLAIGLAAATVPSRAAAEIPGLRVGASLAGGGFAGSVQGAYGGAQLRLGVQWNHVFATYVQAQGLIGGFVPASAGADVVGSSQNELMFEATIASLLQLGVGPSLDWVWGCNADSVQGMCGSTGPFFGLDGRVALRIALFTVSLDVHPTWLSHDAIATWVTLGLGFDL